MDIVSDGEVRGTTPANSTENNRKGRTSLASAVGGAL